MKVAVFQQINIPEHRAGLIAHDFTPVEIFSVSKKKGKKKKSSLPGAHSLRENAH